VAALELNATKRPSAEMAGEPLKPARGMVCAPADDTDTRVVAVVCRSCTKTSCLKLVSPGTRLVRSDENAAKRPSSERAGS
jgi:hypothetical protein